MPEEVIDSELPLEYQLFALSFRQEGAISYFSSVLPANLVGAIHGNTGVYEFYQAMLDFYKLTELDPIDPVAFRSWLESETDIHDALGGTAGVSTLLDIFTSLDLGSPESVVAVLKKRANKRQQLDLAHELQKLINSKDHKTSADRDRLYHIASSISQLESELDYNPFQDVTTADDIASRAENLLNLPDFLSTPYLSLNRAMGYTDDGGFFRGAVHAVLAPSGKGKSTFTKCLVNHWADQGYRTLFINYEEAQAHWETILMTQLLKRNVYAQANTWSDDERQEYIGEFRDHLATWGDRFMVRHDPDTSYFDDLEHWLRDLMGHPDQLPDVVVIDTIQSMLAKGGTRWEQFEQMMIKLERLAREMNAVFIVTAQQNNEAIKENREMIKQSDAGGSVTIIQKSSVAIFITEKKLATGNDAEDDYVMQLQIPKNRITGGNFILNPPIVVYNDSTKSYDPLDLENVDYDTMSTIADFDMEDLGGLRL